IGIQPPTATFTGTQVAASTARVLLERQPVKISDVRFTPESGHVGLAAWILDHDFFSENPCLEGKDREKIWQTGTSEELAVPSYRSGASEHAVRLPHHVVDLDADELRSAAGQHVDLRPRSLAVLRLLAENAGHLTVAGYLMMSDTVWDEPGKFDLYFWR